ncbi:hydrogenase nickel incorporation protein HypA/HybF [Lachnospiraceae bacterium]|nr:hydrogenase nickel incorporation protein HypA/HybF [Lachnospiraceae bacterium]
MHELPIVEDLIRTLDKETEEKHFKKIMEINLVIGELSGVVDECVSMYFEMLSEGHSCEKAELHFEHTHAMLKCAKCGHEFPHGSSFSCPECGGEVRLIKGTGSEFLVKSIKAEQE